MQETELSWELALNHGIPDKIRMTTDLQTAHKTHFFGPVHMHEKVIYFYMLKRAEERLLFL